MSITGNVVAGVSHIPLVLSQKLREELSVYAFNTPSISTVTAAGIAKLDQHDVIMQEFQAREEAIQADALSSDQGKRVKMEAVAKEFFERVRFIAEAAENRRQAAAELRKELERPKTRPGDPVVETLREQEIRAELRKLAQSERMKLLAQSLEQKNLTFLRAVENNPLGASELIPDDYRARLREQWLETDQAAELERWKALVFVGDKLQLLANVLETTLGRYRLDVPAFPAKTDTCTVDLNGVNTQAPPDKSKTIDKKPEHVGAFQ